MKGRSARARSANARASGGAGVVVMMGERLHEAGNPIKATEGRRPGAWATARTRTPGRTDRPAREPRGPPARTLRRSMRDDIRFGLRLLLRDRGFTLAALLTLAICIGANTALFSVIHGVLLSPLPVPDSDRIVLMGNCYPGAGVAIGENSSVPHYFDRLRETDVFTEQALFRTRN